MQVDLCLLMLMLLIALIELGARLADGHFKLLTASQTHKHKHT